MIKQSSKPRERNNTKKWGRTVENTKRYPLFGFPQPVAILAHASLTSLRSGCSSLGGALGCPGFCAPWNQTPTGL
eukprot:441893-Amphidinium_carterae.1